MTLGEILTGIAEGEQVVTEVVADEAQLATGAAVTLPELRPTIAGSQYKVDITVQKVPAA